MLLCIYLNQLVVLLENIASIQATVHLKIYLKHKYHRYELAKNNFNRFCKRIQQLCKGYMNLIKTRWVSRWSSKKSFSLNNYFDRKLDDEGT